MGEVAKVITWMCEECGFKFTAEPPKDRAKFYANPKAKVCRKCKSEAVMPVGF